MLEMKAGYPDTERATWRPTKSFRRDPATGKYLDTAMVSCPKCGQLTSCQNLEISADGLVSPTLVCSFQCSFRDVVKLLGWPKYEPAAKEAPALPDAKLQLEAMPPKRRDLATNFVVSDDQLRGSVSSPAPKEDGGIAALPAASSNSTQVSVAEPVAAAPAAVVEFPKGEDKPKKEGEKPEDLPVLEDLPPIEGT